MANLTTMDHYSIGKRIRERRQQLEITQGKLSEKIDVSGSFIGHIERGEKIPSLETMARLSDALGVSLDWLVFGINLRCEREPCPLFGDLETMLRAYGLSRE